MNAKLRSFRIQNFKSLVDFSLDDMGQFVCLVGLNGAGKTSVLQAIDFVAHLAAGGLNEWFKDREWSRNDIESSLTTKRNIDFEIEVKLEEGTVRWRGAFNPSLGRCSNEEIWHNGEIDIFLEGGQINFIGTGEKLSSSRFEYQGSLISFFNMEEAGYLNQFKEFLRQFKSLELLSPNRMRSRSRNSDDVGVGGEKLAGYLHNLSSSDKSGIQASLKKFYPRLIGIGTKAERAGWAQLHFYEDYPTHNPLATLETEARHINDGLLRILTLVAQVQTDHQFLLFDEIENGINPELVGQLMDYLLSAPQQIMVTTHNPVILNFLPDDRAKESVYFLYRTPKGETRAKRFFDIPEVAEKLEILGPGEVFLDTSLTQLAEELGQQ